jgi:hypothetical protein
MQKTFRLCRSAFVLAASLLVLSGPVQAADYLTFDLSGTTQADGWANLTTANYPGYGTFPGAGAWPAPIGSNTAGSGDADLNKISGNGYPAGASIYAPFTNSVFQVSDGSAVANLETVVFQLQIGTAYGLDLSSAPTLSYNGGSQALVATYAQLVSSTPNGDFGGSPTILNVLAYQWDLSGIEGTINSFSVSWAVAPHTQTYGVKLDQGSMMDQVVAVPEPSTYAIAVGLVALIVFRLRRQRANA